MSDYQWILSRETFDRVEAYLAKVRRDMDLAGSRMRHGLDRVDLSELDVLGCLEILLNSKRPQIFAESAVAGDGRDWTLEELGLLGDISTGMPVTFFDDGGHVNPDRHDAPFEGVLVYTPGALLRNGMGVTPADWTEVHPDDAFNLSAYTALYRRRLLPIFRWIEQRAAHRKRPALVTIPGLGCGQFAGVYHGQMGRNLEKTLAKILSEDVANLPNIRVVWFDPYNECEMQTREFEHMKFMTRPLAKDIFPRPQLSLPRMFGFEDLELYSLVAWDHVSWPGNDYYIGSRATDDGVKAAATNTMQVMTGITGTYHPQTAKYLPPANYANWNDVVKKHEIKLRVARDVSLFKEMTGRGRLYVV